MKRCPECGREYDNTMMFCLDDGQELLYGPAAAESPAAVGGQVGDGPRLRYFTKRHLRATQQLARRYP